MTRRGHCAGPAANGVVYDGATLNVTVNPNGQLTTAQVEYGLDANSGGTASMTLSPHDASSAQAESAPITGLIPDTTYHYRLTATNSEGVGNGADMIFKTLPSPTYRIVTSASPPEQTAGAQLRP